MVATKDYIYYVNQDDDITIYRLATDGAEDEKLIDISCNSFGLLDGFIYLTDNKETISISIDTLERKLIAADATFYTILDGNLVIKTNSNNYVVIEDGTRVSLDSEGFTYFSHDQQWQLNYSTPLGYLYITVNGERKLLVDKPCFNINTTDEKVYFKMYVEEKKEVFTYCTNYDGSDMRMVA